MYGLLQKGIARGLHNVHCLDNGYRGIPLCNMRLERPIHPKHQGRIQEELIDVEALLSYQLEESNLNEIELHLTQEFDRNILQIH